jgi:protein phosphatase
MIIADQYCIYVINAMKDQRSLDSLKDWQVGFSHILNMATNLVEAEDNILYLEGEIKIFGDIHGDLEGLLKLWEEFGSPLNNSKNEDISSYKYLFLGDFVDRGSKSLEIIFLLVFLKVLHQKKIFLIRGNH